MFLQKILNPIESCDLKFGQAAGTHTAETDGIFAGYASKFGGVDSFGDTILAGAFADALESRTRPIKMFMHHNPTRVVGIWSDVKEDDIGLSVVGELTPNHTDAANAYASMKHGAMDGLSIGFRLMKDDFEEIEGGGRRIHKISELIEISIVSMPADGGALIGQVKSIADEIKTIESIRDAELFLRDAGNFPRSMAKALISQLRSVYLRDAESEAEQKDAMARDLEWLRNLTK